LLSTIPGKQSQDFLGVPNKEHFLNQEGIYNKRANMIAVDAFLDEFQHKKVIYHEIGHEDHDPSQYDRRRE
jgi:hypothetical protein